MSAVPDFLPDFSHDGPAAAPRMAAGQSQVAGTLTRMRLHLGRTAMVMVVLCTTIALFLNGFALTRLGPKLVYSFSIGCSCWAANCAGRLLAAWWFDRRQSLRGLPTEAGDFGSDGWIGVAVGMLLGFLIGPPLGLSLGDWFSGSKSPSLLQLDSTATRITLVITVVGSVITAYVLSNFERLASARAKAEAALRKAEAAQRQAAETQLRLLQSQLEPHMLFNTLANLRVLIGMDPTRAQAMLDRLIAFLRATLNASRVPQHPLATEFERLNDYLALMAIRMGPRLAVTLALPEALRGLPVPPLLLQPLVENSIKHGLEPKVAGGRIDVSARLDAGFLLLDVRDTGLGLATSSDSSGSHFGLAQVRERLVTLYGSKASLVIENTGDAEGGTRVTLRLPLAADGQPQTLITPTPTTPAVTP